MLVFNQAKQAQFTGLLATQVANLLYLEQLANTTQANIQDWDVTEFIEAADKRAINKLFFSRKESTGQGDASVDDKLIADVVAAAASAREADRVRLLEDAKSNREYALNQARAYQRNVDTKLAEAHNYTKRINSIENRDNTDLREQMEKILKNPFYEYVATDNPAPNLSNGHLKFRTRNEIILTLKNTAARVDLRVPLGKFRVQLTLRDGGLLVLPIENNVTTQNGYFHPYLSNNGSVCWGNASDTAHNLQATGNFGDLLSLLASLLSTYDDSTNPYVTLYELEREAIRKGKIIGKSTATPNPEVCDICDEDEDHCDCFTCECGQRVSSGDGCEGYYCPTCNTCTGVDLCDDHWCRTCGEYEGQGCDRCPECERHEEHESDCGRRPPEVREDEIPF